MLQEEINECNNYQFNIMRVKSRMIKLIWVWLRDEHNRGSIVVIGTALTVVVGAVWTLFVYFNSVSGVEQDIELANWKSAFSIRNEFTASDWSSDWQQSYIGAELRKKYLQNIGFLKGLNLNSLNDVVNEVEIELLVLPNITEVSSPPPGEEYKRLFKSFREKCNKLVKRIGEGATRIGVENQQVDKLSLLHN